MKIAFRSQAALPLVAKIQQVSDGDTIIATSKDGTRRRIRLLAINDPEMPPRTETGPVLPGGRSKTTWIT